jgi:hypothetical protein
VMPCVGFGFASPVIREHHGMTIFAEGIGAWRGVVPAFSGERRAIPAGGVLASCEGPS